MTATYSPFNANGFNNPHIETHVHGCACGQCKLEAWKALFVRCAEVHGTVEQEDLQYMRSAVRVFAQQHGLNEHNMVLAAFERDDILLGLWEFAQEAKALDK